MIFHYYKGELYYWVPQISDVFSCYYELIPPFVFSFNHFVNYLLLALIFCKHFRVFKILYPKSNKYSLNYTVSYVAEGGSTGSTDLHIKAEFFPQLPWWGRLERVGWALKEIPQMQQAYVLIWAGMISSFLSFLITCSRTHLNLQKKNQCS